MTDVEPAEVARFTAARAAVFERIERACAAAGRDASSVSLVAVSKTVPPERVRAALAAGQTVFGENRVQEGAEKRPLVGGGTWRLLGPLQGNKARRAVETFDAIDSLDSVDLARRLDRIVREVCGLPAEGPVVEVGRYPVLLQVNVDDDPAKAGFSPAELAAALPELTDLGALRLAGCMTIGRLVPDAELARPTFRGLRELVAGLRAQHPTLGPDLSMGMSDDYPVAVEEGATIVRVGRALFGDRVA